jgi:hypothetical protein
MILLVSTKKDGASIEVSQGLGVAAWPRVTLQRRFDVTLEGFISEIHVGFKDVLWGDLDSHRTDIFVDWNGFEQAASRLGEAFSGVYVDLSTVTEPKRDSYRTAILFFSERMPILLSTNRLTFFVQLPSIDQRIILDPGDFT